MGNLVTILLASYNGAKYISEQLDSLISQSYSNWNLNIRDDGSTDDTILIIKKYCKLDPRISLVEDDLGNLRSCQNFATLMNSCRNDSNYYMFCDQDDIWLPNKIELTLAAIQCLEKRYGNDKPLLVYGTYIRIDEDGNDLKLEIPNYALLPDFKVLLSQNYVYGCTMMVNKSLLEKSTFIPSTAENHDYWIVLTAISFDASFLYIDQPLLLYRQHSNNVSGSYLNASFIARLKRLWGNLEAPSLLEKFPMYVSLYDLNGVFMSVKNKKTLGGYIKTFQNGGLGLFFFCLRNRFRRITYGQTILFYFNILRMRELFVSNKENDD